MRALTLTRVPVVCVCRTNSFAAMAAPVQHAVHRFCDVSTAARCAADDLRPSAGAARTRDSRATQTGEDADIDGRCFLLRNGGERKKNQYSAMHLILFDSFFESESMKHCGDDMRHFAGVVCAHPAHVNGKEKLTALLQIVFALHSSEDKRDYCQWDVTVKCQVRKSQHHMEAEQLFNKYVFMKTDYYLHKTRTPDISTVFLMHFSTDPTSSIHIHLMRI